MVESAFGFEALICGSPWVKGIQFCCNFSLIPFIFTISRLCGMGIHPRHWKTSMRKANEEKMAEEAQDWDFGG